MPASPQRPLYPFLHDYLDLQRTYHITTAHSPTTGDVIASTKVNGHRFEGRGYSMAVAAAHLQQVVREAEEAGITLTPPAPA